jgi:hypothetical protein
MQCACLTTNAKWTDRWLLQEEQGLRCEAPARSMRYNAEMENVDTNLTPCRSSTFVQLVLKN